MRRSAARTTEVVRTEEHAPERMQLFVEGQYDCVLDIPLVQYVLCAVVRSLVGEPPSSRLLAPYGG